MATANCTVVGVRARCKDAQGNGPYWYCANGGNHSSSVDDSDTWGVNDGQDFYSGNVNPCISATGGNNKYTVCIKVTTPNLSNVTISSITISCRLFNHSQKSASSYPLYASLRTTSSSDNSDTVDTWRNYAVGSEASTTSITGNELNVQTWSPTFTGSFSPNTSYYLFLYAKSTSIIYGAYMSGQICSGAYVTYTQNAATYTVSLTKGTGISSVSGSGTYTEGDSVSISATPSTGYKFVNWTGYATSTSNPLTFTINQNRSYTANATKLTYTVSYKVGTYGSGTNSTATKTYGTALTLKGAQFTRTGYTQTGWASDAAGTNLVYALSGSYTTNAAITLYPYWEPNIYILTINPNGGSMWNGDNKTSNSFTTDFAYATKTYIGNLMSAGTFYPDNAPTRTGYTFNSFSFSGGSGQKNTAGETFYFMGEHAGAASGTSTNTNTWIFNGNYAGDVTATAQWTGNTYYVQYNSNGGTGTMSNSTHTYGTSSALRANAFTRTNFSFIGWNTAADGSGTSYSDGQTISTLIASGTVQLYAQWGEATYNIVFDMNGGYYTSGSFNTMTCVRGTSYTLPTGTILREGYTFKGWSTSSTATSATYANGASISNISEAGTTVTLYAVWAAKSIKIKYNINNGGTTSSTVTYNATSTTNTLSALPSSWTRSGYVAAGWATSSTATSPDYKFSQSFSGDLGIADGGTLNLYVVWVLDQPWKLALFEARRSSTWKVF